MGDFYYRLVQDSYYTLASRNFDFHDLGVHMMEYMNFGIARGGPYSLRKYLINNQL